MDESIFNNYAKFLIDKAKEAQQCGEVPVSAIAIYENKIIATATNTVKQTNNKLAHAEINLLQILQNQFNTTHFFDKEISVYITLEPCCMCASALAMCGIRNVFYMLEDEKFGGVSKVFVNTSYFKPNFYFVFNEEYHLIIQKFFKEKR